MNYDHFQNTVRYRNQRIGQPNQDIVIFAELLRDLGLTTSVSQILDASKALLYIDILNRSELFESLKCTLTRSPEEQEIFSEAFFAFWQNTGEGHGNPESPQTGSKNEGAGTKDGQGNRQHFMSSANSQLGDSAKEDGGKHASFSPLGTGHSDPLMNTEQLSKKMKQHIYTLVRLLQSRYSRRRKKDNKGDQLYFRNLIRANMKYGGEPIAFSRTARKKRKLQLVTLCDVSTSMNPFTPFFLKFLHTLTQIVPITETAVFNVKMEFISGILKKFHSLDKALHNINKVSTGLSGGTRIGESLFSFNQELKKRKLANHQTIAIILSDGWDVGDTQLLGREMRKLSANVSRVIWLHPYAHIPGFKPEVEGLQVSIPFIDDFLPFYGPSSINTFVTHLKGILR
jgi:uncharacterized protein with von Willebrand factor type A (vWA) domain